MGSAERLLVEQVAGTCWLCWVGGGDCIVLKWPSCRCCCWCCLHCRSRAKAEVGSIAAFRTASGRPSGRKSCNPHALRPNGACDARASTGVLHLSLAGLCWLLAACSEPSREPASCAGTPVASAAMVRPCGMWRGNTVCICACPRVTVCALCW